MEVQDIKVYVAGALQNPSQIKYLGNSRKMIKGAKDILVKYGLTPFCPAVDMLFFLGLENDEEITRDMIVKYSMYWLMVCDIVFVLRGWEDSEGTKHEIAKATELGIPVVYYDYAWLEKEARSVILERQKAV